MGHGKANLWAALLGLWRMGTESKMLKGKQVPVRLLVLRQEGLLV